MKLFSDLRTRDRWIPRLAWRISATPHGWRSTGTLSWRILPALLLASTAGVLNSLNAAPRDYVYLASSAGLEVIDPVRMQRVGAHPTVASRLAVVGNHAFLASGDGLKVVDISDPSNPTLVGGFNTKGAWDLAVQGDCVYLAAGEAGLQVIDVSDPRNPTPQYGRDNATDEVSNVVASGNLLYVVHHNETVRPLNPRWLTLYDISNPTDPQALGSYRDDLGVTIIMRAAVSGNHAFVTSAAFDSFGVPRIGHLEVIDASNPTELKSVGGYDSDLFIIDVAVSGDRVYLTGLTVDGFTNGHRMEVIDISNPADPRRVGRVDTGASWYGSSSTGGIAVLGSYAYMTDWVFYRTGADSILHRFDVTTASTPAGVGDYHEDNQISSDVAVVEEPGGVEPGPCHPMPNRSVAWWPGEGSGVDGILGRAGTLLGGVGYEQGKVGQAFALDGNDDCVETVLDDGLSFPEVTIEAWVRPDAQVQDPSNQTLIAGQYLGLPQLVVGAGTNGVTVSLQFGPNPLPSAKVTASEQIPLGQFSHVAGTWDGQLLRVYVNGVLKGESRPTAAPSPPSGPFFLGGIQMTNGTVYSGKFFRGLIDEVTLYARALVGSEVLSIYTAGTSGKCPPLPPSIWSQPQGQTVLEGGNATFSVTASGTGPFAYQWFLGNHPVAGATDALVTLTNVTVDNAGSYTVVVAGLSRSITSNPAILIVQPLPHITVHPESRTAQAGSSVSFSVVATGAGPFTYRWWHNGHNGLPIAQGAVLLLGAVRGSDAGTYSVQVMNANGLVESKPAQLVVVSGTISAKRGGASLVLNVNGLAEASYAVEWSADLKTWNPLATILNAPANWQVEDPNGVDQDRRFYRLRLL